MPTRWTPAAASSTLEETPKSGRVHLAEGSNVVVLELPYSTEFGRVSRKFASGVRKYGKFSHLAGAHKKGFNVLKFQPDYIVQLAL